MKVEPDVLLVDDNPADIDLTSEILAGGKRPVHVSSVADGAEAISFLRKAGKYSGAPRPDFIVLDLNLPRQDGREVLQAVKTDVGLAQIPVVVFSTSQAAADVNRSYELGANGYLPKPGNFPEFRAAVQSMAAFWLHYASLPGKGRQ